MPRAYTKDTQARDASTVRDGYIAKEADGITPSHILVGAWRSVLGDSDADTYLDEAGNCKVVANPEQNADGKQIDTDGDGAGDPCDPTPQGTTPPTIVVPGHITVDATVPAGVTVTYTVTATDDIDAHPTVTCTPSAGSVFAIGDTPVACASTDAAVRLNNDSCLVVETKGQEDLDVALKDRRARRWCQDAARLSGRDWAYEKVPQKLFDTFDGDTIDGSSISAPPPTGFGSSR
jgi:HYR domain-containing protein